MTGKEAKAICNLCPMKTWNPPEELKTPLGTVKIFPGFYSCGKFGVKNYDDPIKEQRSCGCVITLKTIFKKLTSCPQGKW